MENKMSVTYNWIIEQMQTYPEIDGYSNVVFMIHWRCNAEKDNYSATNYGSVNITFNNLGAFTPYDSLTQDQVIKWVKDSLGKDQVSQIEEWLSEKIDNLINPTEITLPNPWVHINSVE